MMEHQVELWITTIVQFILSYKTPLRRIAIQTPSIFEYRQDLLLQLQEKQQNTKIYSIGDSACTTCCVDIITAMHIEADFIVHFGPACFSTSTKIPIQYILDNIEQYNIKLIEKICDYNWILSMFTNIVTKDTIDDNSKQIITKEDDKYIHRKYIFMPYDIAIIPYIHKFVNTLQRHGLYIVSTYKDITIPYSIENDPLKGKVGIVVPTSVLPSNTYVYDIKNGVIHGGENTKNDAVDGEGITKNNVINDKEITKNSTINDEENNTVNSKENSTINEEEKNTVNSKKNSTINEEEKKTVNSKENSAVKNEENNTVNSKENSTVKNEENNIVNSKENSTVKNEENNTVNSKENSTVKNEENNIVNSKENSTVKNEENNAVNFVENNNQKKKLEIQYQHYRFEIPEEQYKDINNEIINNGWEFFNINDWSIQYILTNTKSSKIHNIDIYKDPSQTVRGKPIIPLLYQIEINFSNFEIRYLKWESTIDNNCIYEPNTELHTYTKRYIFRRYIQQEKIQKCCIFGIIIHTVILEYQEKIINYIKNVLKKYNKKYYVIVLSTINEVKLLNFPIIECFVAITCPLSLVYERENFTSTLLISPLELGFALQNLSWDGTYSTDPREIVSSHGRYSTELSPIEREEDSSSKKELFASMNNNEMINMDYIHPLSFYGQDPHHPPPLSPMTIHDGLFGIASSYIENRDHNSE